MKATLENSVGLPVRPGSVLGGRYWVVRCLGTGGCGVVFLALDLTARRFVALKTFRDEFAADPERRRAFEREALVWVMLGRHRWIVEAEGVEYFQGRHFIVMEYVRSDTRGRVSLSDYLTNPNRRLTRKQILKWTLQFCLAMEYAHRHGLESHGDIKPGNLLITPGGDLKIVDFSIARACRALWPIAGCVPGSELDPATRHWAAHLWSDENHSICGTPGYIAPEVLQGHAANVRSDIYSFGLVLYQMAMGCPVPPFLPTRGSNLGDFVQENLDNMIYHGVPKVRGPFSPIIEKCLQPDSRARFPSFSEIRKAVERIHHRKGIKRVAPVKTSVLGPDQFLIRGASLLTLDCPDQAAECFREATRLAPGHAPAWVGSGEAALRIGRLAEAKRCINRAIVLDLRCGAAWRAKGLLLERLGFCRVALRCFQKAVALDPQDSRAWLALGFVLARLGLVEEGRKCVEETLAKDLKNAAAWEYRGLFQDAQGQFLEAIESYKFALNIDPQSETALVNMGIALDALQRHRDAIACYNEALRINLRSAAAWSNRGASLAALGYFSGAVASCERALQLPEVFCPAWRVKGLSLIQLGQKVDALDCLSRATELDPRQTSAWLSRGDAEASLGMYEEASYSWSRARELDGGRDRSFGEQIRQRFEELHRAKVNRATSIPAHSPRRELMWQPAEPKMRPPLPRARAATRA
jgi:tetratricopeptide (TPR) repeat protein